MLSHQNLFYKLLKKPQRVTTDVDLGQQPETQPRLQPEAHRAGQPGRAIIRIATEH